MPHNPMPRLYPDPPPIGPLIIARGDVFEGLTLFGPFTDPEEAARWAERSCGSDSWRTARLHLAVERTAGDVIAELRAELKRSTAAGLGSVTNLKPEWRAAFTQVDRGWYEWWSEYTAEVNTPEPQNSVAESTADCPDVLGFIGHQNDDGYEDWIFTDTDGRFWYVSDALIDEVGRAAVAPDPINDHEDALLAERATDATPPKNRLDAVNRFLAQPSDEAWDQLIADVRNIGPSGYSEDEAAAIAKARAEYAMPSDNDLEIDDRPATSVGDDGIWVAAWVFVRDVEADEEEDEEEED